MSSAQRRSVDLLDPHFYAGDPHPDYAWMRTHEPVYRDEKNGLWGVTTLDGLREVEKDAATYSSKGHYRVIPRDDERTMISQDDPEHLAQRQRLSDLFTPRAVSRREGEIRAVVVDAIERFFVGPPVDAVENFAARIPGILTARLLGLGDAQWRNVKVWSERLMRLDRALLEPSLMMDAVATMQDYEGAVRDALARSREKPIEDVPSRWVAEPALDFPTIMEEMGLLVSGGAETTRTTIGRALILFCEHPEAWETLARHPDRIPTAVEELLRIITPLNNMLRRATCDTELEGRRIAAGDRLMLLYPSANRDERHFDEPHRFVPERDPNPHIAFGFGTHFCLGAAFARLTLRVVFEELTARLTKLQAVSPPRYEANIFVKAVQRFELAYERR